MLFLVNYQNLIDTQKSIFCVILLEKTEYQN